MLVKPSVFPHNLLKCPFRKSETDFETEHAVKPQISKDSQKALKQNSESTAAYSIYHTEEKEKLTTTKASA